MNKKTIHAKPACQICGCDKRSDLHRGVFVRPVVADLIRIEVGRREESGRICKEDLQKFCHRYVQQLLLEEKGEISSLEQEVI